MLYQNLLMGSKPYHIGITRMTGFEVHRHPEIELIYCLEGEVFIAVDRRILPLSAGDLAVVGSMVSHEIPDNPTTDCRAMVIEVGPVLLGEYFEPLAKLSLPSPVLTGAESGELYALLSETANLAESALPFSELSVRGNIYKLCACLLKKLMESAPASASKNLVSISKVEKALELIESRFTEPLSVDYVASICGYGKSNFCRIFKRVTGSTFHSVLTRRRIQAAQLLLRETDAALESIAAQIGFADAKSFCRAFKRESGTTPGEYRKRD